MSYEVIVERKARKALARVPSTVYDRALQGRSGRRIRAGDYRIVYDVDDDRREVFVAEVWHRQRGYR